MTKKMMIVLFSSIIGLFNISADRASANEVSIDFYEGSLKEAKTLAGMEGKLAFVEFHADWCSPCKWMEKTTFTDPSVSSFLNDNYVSVKVDIDDIDGYAWKEQYNVATLPTMLIFNSKGELVDRIEETVSPTNLLNILKVHNYAENKITIKHEFNTSPKDYREAKKKRKRTKTTRSQYLQPRKRTSFRLDVGHFDNYEKASDFYRTLSDQFIEPIIVLNDFINGKVIYKVMMGDFKTEKEANEYSKILSDRFQISSVVN